MLLNLAKASDTVDHAILIEKLEYAGIRGVALNVKFESYLSNRQQLLKIEGIQGKKLKRSVGVLQGIVF